MNVLFFYTAHYRLNLVSQIQIEIILGHLQAGDGVHIVACGGRRDLDRCAANPYGKRYFCHACLRMQAKIYTIVRRYGHVAIHAYSPRRADSPSTMPQFDTIEQLKGYTYRGINVGLGAASSTISLLRDHGFSLHRHARRVGWELVKAQQTIDTLERLVGELRPGMVYTFNGRMSEYAAVVQWCRGQGQPLRVYEFTSRRDFYHIVRDTIPHDIDYETADIEQYWADPAVSLKEKIDRGSTFYENAQKGISLLEESFISAQKAGKLPAIEPGREVITFFNSSIDEYASVPGWEHYIRLFDDEVDAIEQICGHYAADRGKQFILRIHPNLKHLDNTQTRQLRRLAGIPNLIIVAATSDISSYTLLRCSDKIITFGSTVGAEATYFGKASISLGLSFYRDLDVAYAPRDRAALYTLLDTPALAPKPQINALKYGYWWVSFGEPFVHRNATYDPRALELNWGEKCVVLLRKIGSGEILRRAYKLFRPVTYHKLHDRRFRQALLKEFMPWNKV